MTIAVHLMAGGGSLVTATDTQETYSNGAKVDAGKIAGAWRADPLGSVNIAGAGDSPYIDALTQDIVRHFQGFRGTQEQLERSLRRLVRAFYTTHVLPFVGQFEDENVPDFRLLVAARHQGTSKLWKVNKTLVTESVPFDCVGIGKAAAETILNKLYPLYPTLDSVSVLVAYAIFRVKNNTDGCGLKTEIRFIHRDRPGIVPPALIDQWESLFRKYDRMEREVFCHAMNFVISPALPKSLAEMGAPPSEARALSEIVEDIEKMRKEFSELKILKQSSE
jgi:hypothetical protein